VEKLHQILSITYKSRNRDSSVDIVATPRRGLVPGDIYSGVKRQAREADHSPPNSAEVQNISAVSTLHHSSLERGA
jgi:hypothetical protein